MRFLRRDERDLADFINLSVASSVSESLDKSMLRALRRGFGLLLVRVGLRLLLGLRVLVLAFLRPLLLLRFVSCEECLMTFGEGRFFL